MEITKPATQNSKPNLPSKQNLLLGCSGSVAAILLRELIEYANKRQFNIKVILTNNAKFFADLKLKENRLKAKAGVSGQENEEKEKEDPSLKADYAALQKELNCEIFFDDDEWLTYSSLSSEVLHIELRKWADLLLLAPLSANSLAKIANGLSDNLLTCVVKAWDVRKPVFFACSMNTMMFFNKVTEEHRERLKKEFGFWEVPVVSKKLKCGEVGKGALAQISDIFKVVEGYLQRKTIFDYFKVEKKSNKNSELIT